MKSWPTLSYPGCKEMMEDKVKAPAKKGNVLHKGRFSVTSDDSDFEVMFLLAAIHSLSEQK